MATAETLIPEKEIKVEGEKVSRKDKVKVTNLLSEIRTTDLPKDSPMQVDPSEDKQSKSEDKEGEEVKDGGNKMDGKKEKEAKEDEVKKVDEGGKKAEDVTKVDKKAEEIKKSDSEKKKTEDAKKAESENKKTVDTKKAEKDGKKADEKKVESGDKKNDSSRKSSKSDKVSPLASFFLDWDKFTTEQKLDIERFVREKAEKMGVSSKLKPGVRTLSDRERNWYRWSAIRRRRRREAIRRMESLRGPGSRPSRDRRPPTRFRGAGDTRYRNLRDDRRRRGYSPRREVMPWRSPWTAGPTPVQHVLKEMERFVQMVNMLPNPNSVVRVEPKRLALLPTPPEGYMSSRANGLRDDPIKDKQLLNTETNFGPSQRWPPVQQFPVNGKEPSSRSPWKQRPSPYNGRSSFSSTALRKDNWSSRERDFPQATTAVAPFKESRYSPFHWRRN